MCIYIYVLKRQRCNASKCTGCFSHSHWLSLQTDRQTCWITNLAAIWLETPQPSKLFRDFLAPPQQQLLLGSTLVLRHGEKQLLGGCWHWHGRWHGRFLSRLAKQVQTLCVPMVRTPKVTQARNGTPKVSITNTSLPIFNDFNREWL